jgi:hypothetical protein
MATSALVMLAAFAEVAVTVTPATPIAIRAMAQRMIRISCDRVFSVIWLPFA